MTVLQKRSGLVFAVILLSTFTFAAAQLPKLPEIEIKVPELDRILQKEPSITSNINDAVYEVPFLDGFNPAFFNVFTDRPRGPKGGVMLSPGLYESLVQSYCLHAGTYGPSKGDGYSYAPLKGQFATIVQSTIRGSLEHPDIPQHDIQVLLWALIARTKFSDMSAKMQATAAKLLTPKQLFEVNGGALSLIPEEKLAAALPDLPPQMQKVLQAEARLRSMLTTVEPTYEQLERVAVLTGIPPIGEGSREVPRGRWSLRPDGFFVRYFPRSYPQTLVQIYVPEKFDIQRDTRGRITGVSDALGSRIDFEYNESTTPASVSGDQNVKGYAFKKIHFLYRLPVIPEATLNLEVQWDNVGWTLVGIPSEKGKPGQMGQPFSNLEERYNKAIIHKKQLNQLDKQFKPKDPVDDIVDLAHLSIALEEILSSTPKAPAPWATEHADLIKKAWQYVAAKRECGISVEGAVEYTPSGNTAMPGNTGSQRIETSLRPADKGEAKEKACAAIQEDLRKEGIWLAAYEDMQILNMANESGMNWELYDAAVGNLAEWIFDAGGLDAYEPGTLSDEQVSSFFTSTPAEPGAPGSYVRMHARYPDGSIWGHDASGKAIMIIAGDGEIQNYNYALVYNTYLDRFGNIAGQVLFNAAVAHEKTHSKQYQTEGFGTTPDEARSQEMAAYKAGMEKKKEALQDLGCE
ncbi:hypothetical protein IBX73_07590 [candidate division WOR-3 bacterium]|nr:hypothetical protein [candidate division WOR-3 bacterium]